MIDFSGLVDIQIVIVLIIVGSALKHFKFFSSVINKAIPVILTILGVVISICLTGAVTLTSVLIGIVSAVLAVGIHSSGKNMWQLMSGSVMNNTYMASPNTISNGTTYQEKQNVESGTSKGIKIPSLWTEVKEENNKPAYEDCVDAIYMGPMDDNNNEEVVYGIDDNAIG